MRPQILVVDDEMEICEMLSRRYRFMNYSVDTAANGRHALERLAAVKTDIVICDIMMPEMNGVELLEAIRQQYPMIHVIMITAYVTLENVLACMRLGADTCVFKPFGDLAELDSALSRAVADIQRWLDILRDLTAKKPGADGERA